MKIPFLDKLLKKPKVSKEKTDYSSIGLSKPRMGSDSGIDEQLPALPQATPPQIQSQSQMNQRNSSGIINEENLKVKIDLMASQIDNMRIQQETINQKMTNIEQILKQILATHR